MINNDYRENFNTLLRVIENGDAALLEVRRRSDGKEVIAIVAIGRDGEDYTLTPFAIMIDGNPFEMYDPPNSEGGYHKED